MTEVIDISTPVLVYERPRFTEAMYVKARDSPLTTPPHSRTKSLPYLPVRKTSANKSDPSMPNTPSSSSDWIRNLSSRARSISSLRRQSVRSDSSARNKSQSFRAKLGRRLSSVWKRSASFSEGSNSKKNKNNDELVLYVEE